ncbi:MAG: hypothetical protein Q7R74_00785 [bacterium]|nr:hypothetical protein [bacterium]
MSKTSKQVATTTSKAPAKRGFLSLFRFGRKEVERELFDGANVGGFIPSTPYERELLKTVAHAHTHLLLQGRPTTAEEFMKLGRVRRDLRKVILQAVGMKSRIAFPLPNADSSPLKAILEALVNEHGREVTPDGVIVKQGQFEIKFGGSIPRPDQQKAGSAAMLPSPNKTK